MSAGHASIYMIEGESLTVNAIATRTGLHRNTAYKFLRRCQIQNTTPTWSQFPTSRDTGAAAKARIKQTGRKPSPGSYIRIVQPGREHTAPRTSGVEAETTEQFLARGGQIQRLGPHESGNPLRFDYSNSDSAGQRRANARRRPAAGAI